MVHIIELPSHRTAAFNHINNFYDKKIEQKINAKISKLSTSQKKLLILRAEFPQYRRENMFIGLTQEEKNIVFLWLLMAIIVLNRLFLHF